MVRNPVPLLVFVILCVPLSGATESVINEDGPLTIRWGSVNGAKAYHVEVRKENIVFITVTVEETVLKLNLIPGFYEYRVTVLDPLGRPAGETGWHPLRVLKIQKPIFRVVEPLTVREGSGKIRIPLKVPSFQDDVLFYLRSEDEHVAVELVFIEDELFEIQTELGDFHPGIWDLEAVARSEQTYLYPAALTVTTDTGREGLRELDAVTVTQGPEVLSWAKVGAEGELNARITGPDGKDFPVDSVKTDNRGSVLVQADFQDAIPGERYLLELYDPQEADTRWMGTLIVDESEKLKPEPKSKPIADSRFELQVGMPFLISVSDSVKRSPYAGVELAPIFHNQWTARFFRGLSLEIKGAAGFETQGREYYLELGIGPYWRPFLKGWIVPTVNLIIGNRWWFFPESPPKNAITFQIGIGADIRLAKKGILHIGFNIDSETTFFEEFSENQQSENPQIDPPFIGLKIRYGFLWK